MGRGGDRKVTRRRIGEREMRTTRQQSLVRRIQFQSVPSLLTHSRGGATGPAAKRGGEKTDEKTEKFTVRNLTLRPPAPMSWTGPLPKGITRMR